MATNPLAAQCPAITCPSNIVTNATGGACATNVSYAAPVGVNPCGATTTTTFNFTGAMQSFTVPVGVTSITVDAQGAQGGGNGGLGGRAVATIPVTPGEVLQVWVGGRPALQLGPGGFNGGGAITVEPCGSGATYSWPGAGASDVRRGSGLANRLIVGGGGGGQGWSTGLGGGGGGTTGVDGAASWISGTNGKGGSQVAGGLGGFYSGNGGSSPNGTLGVGGNGSPLDTYCTGGGGGGGYYGGGGGYVSAGGGGSSYVAYPGNTSTSTTASFRAGQGIVTITHGGGGPAPTTSLSAGLPSGSSFPVGTSNVTYTVNDGVGNSASCTFTVTVVDAEAPAITCPSNVTAGNAQGACDAIVNYSAPVGTDNCSGVTTSRTVGLASGSAFPIGTSTVTYQATDAAGLTSTCSFSVIVSDNEAPSITCPANITTNATVGACDAVVTFNNPAGTDNCPGVNSLQTAGLASGSTFPVGTTTQTFSATDNAGNSSSCSFTVTVVDAEAPTITCPTSFTVNASGVGCTAVVTYTPPVGTDNCGNATTTLTAGLPSGAVYSQGANLVTYTATDGGGNSASCTFTITVDGTVTSSQSLTICNGGSVTVGSSTYTSAGVYTDVLVSSNGCDSIVTTLLSVTSVNTSTSVSGIVLTAAASGASYQWLDCDNGFAEVPFQSGQSFTVLQTGNYAVAVTENGCTDTSACTAVTVVGLAEEFGSAFTLYPNPGNGKVTLDFGLPFEGLEIRVTDLSGKLLYQRNDVHGRSALLDMRSLSNGVYLVEVRSNDLRRVMRMVVQ